MMPSKIPIKALPITKWNIESHNKGVPELAYASVGTSKRNVSTKKIGLEFFIILLAYLAPN